MTEVLAHIEDRISALIRFIVALPFFVISFALFGMCWLATDHKEGMRRTLMEYLVAEKEGRWFLFAMNCFLSLMYAIPCAIIYWSLS